MDELVGVVLAAGRGRRLGPLGEIFVKGLLPVANEPVIGHHLRLLRDLGVRLVYLVVGHHAPDVAKAIGAGEGYGVEVRYVSQPNQLGSAHALASIRSMVHGPFLLVLGDYYFVAADAFAMVRRLEHGQSAIATKRESNAQLVRDACVVSVERDGRVLDIIEKPTSPLSDLKGTGFYALTPDVFDAVNRTPRTALRDEYELSVSLEILAKTSCRLYSEEIIEWDNNITRPEDLLQCNLEWLDRHHVTKLVGARANVDRQTAIDHAIVGDGAVVHGASRLEQVVVFPDTEYCAVGPVEQSLLTPGGRVDCARPTPHVPVSAK